MNSKITTIVKKALILLLIIILSISMGVFLSIKNRNSNFLSEIKFSELSGDVQVYRDEFGIPTIIAENQKDLFFAQGYEYARDRLFQAEFYRSVANGELSRLFGPDLLVADQFLRNLMIHPAAEDAYNNSSAELKMYINSYVSGLNKYIELHKDNLPLEFQILNFGGLTSGNLEPIRPKPWTPSDVLAIQGVMAQDLSFFTAKKELLRQDLAIGLGVEKTLELLPIEDNQTRDYFLSLDTSSLVKSGIDTKLKFDLLGISGEGIGSNNWVVNGSKTKSGLPILSNDPHLGLATPSIWWQVNLMAKDTGFHVQGYTLPGILGVVIGHNEKVAWGFTNTGTDAIDLFYFNQQTDSTGKRSYYIDGQWKEIETRKEVIPVSGGEDVEITINVTDYGPILNNDIFGIEGDREYAMRWTLYEDTPRNALFQAIYDLNIASNAAEVHEALRNWNVPGQNIVFATVDGDIGYQYTGITPVRRTNGSGILPQNGSDPNFGWDGFQDYEDQYYVINPPSGYIATANEKIDKRDKFYITDFYEIPYRGDRIRSYLDVKNDFTVDDMEKIQSDVLNLYAVDVLDPILPSLSQISLNSPDMASKAIEFLEDWDHQMTVDSVAATIFSTFRIYLEEQTFKDELDSIAGLENTYARYSSNARYLMKDIASNATSIWYDNVVTNSIETRDDIVKIAFDKTIEFLEDKLGNDVARWNYGRVHKVVFEHPIADNAPFVNFNEGNLPNNGSDHTVKAAGATPEWTEDGPYFVQAHGQSMRFVAEVEPTWAKVEGILSPGISGVYGSPHRSDGVQDWINTVNRPWVFSTSFSKEPTYVLRKK